MDDSDIDFDDYDFSSDVSKMSEQEYMAEVNVFERVGGAMDTKLTREEKIVMDPLEKFRYNLKNTVYGLNKIQEHSLFDEQIITYMAEMAINLENIERKNVLSYILGYYILHNKKINKERFKDAIDNILPELGEINVTPPDLIRYGRLWENLLV